MIFKPPKFSISFNIIEILTQFLVLLQYLISILLRIFPLLFLRAIMCHHWICPLRWSTGLLEKETRFKGWLLRHTTTPRKKPYITAVDEICLGDCRWNGTSQRGKGKIFLAGVRAHHITKRYFKSKRNPEPNLCCKEEQTWSKWRF